MSVVFSVGKAPGYLHSISCILRSWWIAQFSPSWQGEETKSGSEEGSTSGKLVVTGHAHGVEPRHWVEHFKKGEVVEEKK